MIGTILMIIGLLAGLIGTCLDPDSDVLPFTFIFFIAFIVSGLLLTVLECI